MPRHDTAIRGWRTQTESTHRRVAISCWPHRREKGCFGKGRRRNQEKCQGALLTVVGTWRKRRAHGEIREYLERGTWFCAHLVAL